MKLLQRNFLALALVSALGFSGLAQAEPAAPASAAASAQAPLDDMGQGKKCNKRDGSGHGMGMMGMGGQPESGMKCNKAQGMGQGAGQANHCPQHGQGCGCAMADRVDELEKRMDMMQMMMKMMMR